MINSLFKDSHITPPIGKYKSCRLRENVRKNVRKNVNQSTTANNYEITTKNPAEISFSGISASTAKKSFYTSPALKKVLEFAADQQLVFGATFALLLTCILRPGAILVLPSKKNKDDQKYASAHSIASGIIGFAISTVVFTPISSGIKKFSENTKSYIQDQAHYLIKDANALKTAKTYLDRLPDIVTAIPKGLLTIALIPPILKYVFKLEKKGKADKNVEHASVDYSLLNFRSNNPQYKSKFANFMGGIR